MKRCSICSSVMEESMVINRIDNVEFRLNDLYDFSWLKKYGTAFMAIDETGSGCVCIGMRDERKKYFCKVAGVNTLEAEVSPEESVEILKGAMEIYKDLKHPNLIKLYEHYSYDKLYVAVFEWENGECLFDHWNFDKYDNDAALLSPKKRFLALPVNKKMKSVDVLFSFLTIVAKKKYAAVDFYDGSIMYDFESDKTIICDIDFFQKSPVTNTMGEDWYGTKRLKVPEEYIFGARIDEQTNVFTLGALLFEFFGEFSAEEMQKRYTENRFIPCDFSKWQLNRESYKVALKAVRYNRRERYTSINEFWLAWNESFV